MNIFFNIIKLIAQMIPIAIIVIVVYAAIIIIRNNRKNRKS